MVRIARPFLLLAAAASLAGCNAARPAEPATTAAVAGPVRLIHHHQTEASVRAVANGTLTVDPLGCLRLGSQLVVWPQNAALDLTKPGVVRIFHRNDDASVEVGEPVSLLVTTVAEPAPAPSCPGPQLAVARFDAAS